MDGRGAGGLSGLIDEVRTDRRRLTRGGGRRARAGGRAQTRRRSRSAPGRRQRPTGAPRPGSGALEAEPGAPLAGCASFPAPRAPASALTALQRRVRSRRTPRRRGVPSPPIAAPTTIVSQLARVYTLTDDR